MSCSIARTPGGKCGLLSIFWRVLMFSRPSLCLHVTMVHAVLRWIPRALACSSNVLLPAAANSAATRCSKSVSSTDFTLGYLKRGPRWGLLIAAISLGAPASTIAQPRMIVMSSASCRVAKSPWQQLPKLRRQSIRRANPTALRRWHDIR